MSIDHSTPGSVHPGATVLVANGIITAAAGDLPLSVLADGAETRVGEAARSPFAA